MMRPMARAATTSDVFNAIAEPQRRDILVLVRAGERPVTDLARELGMSQPRASKHLRALRGGGVGRAREWVGGVERFWNESCDRRDAYVRDLRRTRQED